MTIKFEDLYYKYEVPFFDQIKDSILFDIEKWPRFSVLAHGQNIYNTDYFLQAGQKVPWNDAFKNMLQGHGQWYAQEAGDEELGVNVELSTLVIQNLWFQQYKGAARHEWHTHQGAEMANILYVELPKGVVATTEVYVGGTVHRIDAKEGEIVTFPACYPHRSVEFDSEDMKTVISWNTGIGF